MRPHPSGLSCSGSGDPVIRTAPRTEGQARAVTELLLFARRARGAIAVEQGVRDGAGDVVRVRLWLWTGHLPRGPKGARLDAWEGVDLRIPPDFPFQQPSVASVHSRFFRLPYILWGQGICLYLSPADWDPSAGMAGLLKRLIDFYGRLARGALQGPLVPWHPPVTSALQLGGTVVIRQDLPEEDRQGIAAFLHWAVGIPREPDRVEVMEWLPSGAMPAPRADHDGWSTEDLNLYAPDLQRHGGVLIAAVVLPEPISFTYPRDVRSLREALEAAGVRELNLTSRLLYACEVNLASQGASSGDDDGAVARALLTPLLLIRAAAARGSRPADKRAHFAGWRVLPGDLDNELHSMPTDESPVVWADVYDARPDAVERRDTERPVEWLVGRRVLVLGCGALGAPIAEHCLRAGAGTVHLVDNGRVTPGILVRQPYEEPDIGEPKAEALARRLCRIRGGEHVKRTAGDAVRLLNSSWLSGLDLVVDATANPAVRSKIERLFRDPVYRRPALLTLGVGQDARIGFAALTPSGTKGAGDDLLRRLRLESLDHAQLANTIDTLFPDPDPTKIFQPEPGCSDPTFVGSTTDVSSLAAQLLDSALQDLVAPPLQVTANGEARPVHRSLCIIKTRPNLSRIHLAIEEDHRLPESRGAYDVRLEPRVLEQIRRDTRKARCDVHTGELVSETGGALLGQFDDASGVVWVSRATPPPQGSVGTPLGFELDPSAIQDDVKEQHTRSGGLLTFIGAWHSHPNGSALPSSRDIETMHALSAHLRRSVLLLILGGSAPEDAVDNWSPEVYAEVFPS